MKVFLSWSGPESQAIAKVLRDWLPDLLQSIEPWLSSEDIAKGSPWLQGLTSEVEVVRYGVLCITPSNAGSPWICFEAGAMSVAKGIGRQQVVPLLFGLPPGQLSGPLAQFQAAEFNKEDVFRLAQGLNRALGDAGLPADRLSRQFDRLWPDLQARVDQALSTSPPPPAKRKQEDILEEILEGVRSVVRQQTQFSALLGSAGLSSLANAKWSEFLFEAAVANSAPRSNIFFRPDPKTIIEMKRFLDPDGDSEPPRNDPKDPPQE